MGQERSVLYKLIKGDSALKLKEIETGSVNAIITDPPYLYLKHKLDVPFDEDEVFNEWYRVLKDDGMLVVFGRGVSLSRWVVKLDELGFKFKEEIVWVKGSPSGYTLPVVRKHELAMIFTKGKGKLNKTRIDPLTIPPERINWDRLFKNLALLKTYLSNPRYLKVIQHYIDTSEMTFDLLTGTGNNPITGSSSTYKRTNRALSAYITEVEGYVASTVLEVGHYGNKHHPTQKPTELMEVLLKIVSNEGDVILDPFMGSGSTGVASLNLGRKFIGIEIDDEYFNTAKQRLEETSKNKKQIINRE